MYRLNSRQRKTLHRYFLYSGHRVLVIRSGTSHPWGGHPGDSTAGRGALPLRDSNAAIFRRGECLHGVKETLLSSLFPPRSRKGAEEFVRIYSRF